MTTESSDIICRSITLAGRVQGVGMRPFVYKLAREIGISGSICNEGDHVSVLAQGNPDTVDYFVQRILKEAPAISRPHIRENRLTEIIPADGFSILYSERDSITDAHVPPDYFTCDDCLQELQDPNDRRYGYPFINCTQCGPRYTLITSLPYDRASTTMAGFTLCPQCQQEYEDPTNRRFHAEPIACPVCGPQLQFVSGETVIEQTPQALHAVLDALRDGKLVAIKGIGGYHLCCDALNPEPIRQLRKLKPRPHKPLAVLFPAPVEEPLQFVHRYLKPTQLQSQQLLDSSRPIVLIERKPDCPLPEEITPGLHEIGAMLPYSPLHHLILEALQRPIIATSANLSGEPVFTRREEIEERLSHLVQTSLHHNRPIQRPADDGVYRVISGFARPLRLGRGNAPVELKLPTHLKQATLACGGHMKNTVALAWQDRIVISPHIGELDSPRSLDVFEHTIRDLQSLYGIQAKALVCDLHPGYASSRWARSQSEIPYTEVQHHHAHASVLAGEYPQHDRWLVFAWDGTGYGTDGSIWGSETLLGSPGQWQRVSSLLPYELPGGDRAAREPWRSAAALCWESGVAWHPPVKEAELLHQAWKKKIHCTRSTSAGRLFDAASALLGICLHASFEGQAAMWLEQLALQGKGESLSLPLEKNHLDWRPLLPMLLETRMSIEDRAHCFHESLAQAMLQQAIHLRNLHGEFAVGLCGGVFQNRLLSERLISLLMQNHFIAHLPVNIPVNDAGLCYGQIMEAAALQGA